MRCTYRPTQTRFRLRARDGRACGNYPARLRIRYGRLKQDYPGCQLSGFIMVNRVPGNFHIEARSALHSIDPTAANVR